MRSLFLYMVVLMATANYAFAENNTNQTAPNDTPVVIATLVSGSFVAGRDYLVIGTAQVSVDTAASQTGLDIRQTDDVVIEHQTYYTPVAANERGTMKVCGVWTAVSGQALRLLFYRHVNFTGTASANFGALFALDLTSLGSSNYAFARRTTDDTLTTTPLDGASITFTPSAASDWLVQSFALISQQDTTTSGVSRINRSGEASSVLPESRQESSAVDSWFVYAMDRVFSLAAASNTFVEQSSESVSASHSRLHSVILALNLNAFNNRAFAYTEADASLSATNYATELQTVDITPAVNGDVLLGAYWGFDKNNVGREAEFRVQNYIVGDAQVDFPAGQTTANYQFSKGNDATDEEPYNLVTVRNMTGGSQYRTDLDASADGTAGTPAGQHRSLWAVTMELAATGAVTRRRSLTMLMVGR